MHRCSLRAALFRPLLGPLYYVPERTLTRIWRLIMALAIGDTAPDFEAETTEGKNPFSRMVGQFLGCVILAPKGFHPDLHHRVRHYGPG